MRNLLPWPFLVAVSNLRLDLKNYTTTPIMRKFGKNIPLADLKVLGSKYTGST